MRLGQVSMAAWLVWVCTAGLGWAEGYRLNRFLGREIGYKTATKRELGYLERFKSGVPEGFFAVPEPWLVWRTERLGAARHILLLVEHLFVVPGGSTACVRLIDPKDNVVQSWPFQVGWRASPTRASVEYSDDLAAELLTLELARWNNAPPVKKEYFAIGRDRLRLIRLEDDRGNLARNDYTLPVYEIGLPPPATDAAGLARLLESGDAVEQLSALTFLGAEHTWGFGERGKVRGLRATILGG